MVNLTRRIAVLSVMALVIGVGSLFAQTDRGTITGTVTDSSGARVAGADIAITATQTGIVTRLKSTSEGVYNALNLPIGQYNITVEHPGFKKYEQQGITLSIGQTLGIDIVLQVGNKTEVIQITSEAPQLEAETTNVATTATAGLVQDLPLVSITGEARNPGNFMILDSTVSSRGDPFGGGGGFNDRALSTTVAGAPSASAEFHVDGSILGNSGQVHADMRLIGFPMDAVQEFSINTIAIPAELGHTGGGITSFTLKSGTNQFHGSAFDYLRNNVFDSRGRFNNSVAPLKQNEFGATFGGHIIKDKLFVFGWYDGLRYRGSASNTLATVPLAAFRQGDFSNFQAYNAGGTLVNVPIYNPYSNGGVLAARTQFPGNVINIPFDHVGAGIAALIPSPNFNGGAQYNNYLLTGANAQNQDEYGGKVDYQMSTKNRLSGSFSYSTANTAAAPNPVQGPLSETAPSINKLPVARLSDDYLITSNIVNHVTIGFNRWASGSQPINQVAGGWPAKLGYNGVPMTDGAMLIINGFDGLGQFGGGGGNPSVNNQNNTDINESLSWIKGSHSMKFGMEWLRNSQNSISTGRASGYLFTSNNFTANPLDPNYGTNFAGSGFASFLLGQMDNGQTYLYFAPVDGPRGGYWGAYAQDDWKITRKLTANLGVRWDMYEPSVEVHNHAAWMTPTLVNPDAGGIAGAVQFATPQVRAGAAAQKHDFSPRIGLAYQLNNKTVIRSSFGILFAPGGYFNGSASNFLQGYTVVQTLANTNNDLAATWTLDGGWPYASLPHTLDLTSGYGVGGGVQRLDPQDARAPYMLSRVFQIERQLPSNMVLKVAYIGNHGTRLQSRIDVNNEMPPWYMSMTVADPGNSNGKGLAPAFLTPLADPRVQALPVVASMPIDTTSTSVVGLHAPFQGFFDKVGATQQLGQALLPYPQYLKGSVRRLYEGDGTSDYNALKVDLDKRMSNGLTLLVSYTWSKTLTNAASQFNEFSGYDQNSYNARAQKALSINDYPQNIVITYSYELPFGRGKRFANTGGVVDKVIGGWKVAGIQNYQSGPPQIFTQPCFTGGYEGNGDNGGGFNCRPNILAGVPIANPARGTPGYDPTHTSLVNPAAFVETPNPLKDPGLGYQSYFGNAPALLGGAGRRLPYLNEDISIIKKTTITERVNVEFRADFLNVFNRTVLGWGTGGDMYGSSLGNQIGGGPFGVVNFQSNTPREIQFGLKINY